MLKSLAVGILGAGISLAATLYSVSGPTEANWSAGTGQILYGSWTQTGAYNNVAVSALLAGSGTASAYLTDQVGSTTTGGNVIASTTVGFPGAASTVPLFSSLTLGPGTYYLVIGGTGAGTWPGTFNPVVTTDTGVTANGFGFCSVGNSQPEVCNAAFGPASVFAAYPGSLFSVTGDPQGVPEPAAAALMASALLAMALGRRLRSPKVR